ncbi:unnamed protein product [Brassica oleracea var. botrytis]|uniref:Uncharacterized protein n=1 Tax=Brassica oleracea TaxID=3712 RepID=A0A3P6FT03_BRAOL|nr:unnamed protein product [Brassica oleracea]
MKLSLLHASSGLEKTRHQINTQTYSNESNHRVDLSYFLTTSSSVDTKRSFTSLSLSLSLSLSQALLSFYRRKLLFVLTESIYRFFFFEFYNVFNGLVST